MFELGHRFFNFLINPYLCTESTKKIGGTLGYLNLASHQQDDALLCACGDTAVSQTVPGSL